MGQADFTYAVEDPPVRLELRIDLFGDRRAADEPAAEIAALGFAVRARRPLAALLDIGDGAGDGTDAQGDGAPLADVVLVDIAHCGAADCAALAALDVAATRRGTQVVVICSIAALDTVFACLDQCRPQILIEPSAGDRIVAIGRAVAAALPRPGRVRELDDAERAIVLRLAQEVARIADRLDGLADPSGSARVEAAGNAYSAGAGPQGASGSPARRGRAVLPDAGLIRRIIRARQARARFFDPDLFADPAWDILLDLAAARGEGTRVSVTSLCIASGVPPTTALRWIGQMTQAGLLLRIEDEADRRRVFIALSDRAADAIAAYFAELGPDARLPG